MQPTRSRSYSVVRHPNAHVRSLTHILPAAKPRLLLVEPHVDSSEMYAEYFRYYGVSVMTVSNAADALAAVSEADVVVTNMRLPGEMNGIELITCLRGDQRTAHIPVVVLSASPFWSAAQMLHTTDVMFLAKPCLPEELLRHARRLFLQSTTHAYRHTA